MAKINGRDIVSLKNKVCELFTYNDWMDLGYITTCNDLIEGHSRLLQSLEFDDDDYERNTLEVLKQIIEREENNIEEIKSFIIDKYPNDIKYKSDVNSDVMLPVALFEQSQVLVSKTEQHTMDIFISHSNQDAHIAKLLIDLIRAAFNMQAKKIRCTSVNGYRLPAGASTNEQLKKEVHESKVLVALISPSSMDSTYVLFELGARWAISLPLIPLVTNKLGTQLLKGPLSGINALNISDLSQVHQLITDLEEFLQIESESPAVYQEKADAMIEFLLKEMLSGAPDQQAGSAGVVEDRVSSVDSSIKSYCESQWPDDYTMRVHCIKEQKDANIKLREPKPTDIPEDIFKRIIIKAIHEWPDDYTMQVHSRDEQINAYRELQKF